MTSREQLIQELETLPEQLIDEVLDYVSFIKSRYSLPSGGWEKQVLMKNGGII